MAEKDIEKLKIAAAREAVNFVKDQMIVGLGTGSTAEYFIKLLVERANMGINIKVIASSVRTYKLAKTGNLDVLDINDVDKIDIVVDGADEIDDQKNIIKGGGGALLREKILASASDIMIVIADSSKIVKQLGNRAIPVEMIPYGYKFTMGEIHKIGFKSELRLNENKEPFITDNHNYILDVSLDTFVADPQHIHSRILSIPGVVETGLFFDLNPKLIIASSISDVKIID